MEKLKELVRVEFSSLSFSTKMVLVTVAVKALEWTQKKKGVELENSLNFIDLKLILFWDSGSVLNQLDKYGLQFCFQLQ